MGDKIGTIRPVLYAMMTPRGQRQAVVLTLEGGHVGSGRNESDVVIDAVAERDGNCETRSARE